MNLPVRRLSSVAFACVALALVATVGVVSGRAGASGVAPKAPAVIATVHINRLLQGLDEGKALKEKVDASVKERQAQLDQIQKEITDLRERMEPEVRGSVKYQQMFTQYLELEAQGRVRLEALKQITGFESAAMLLALYDKIAATAEAVAKREGYDAVLVDDRNIRELMLDQPTEAQAIEAILGHTVIYASEAIDITDLLRTQMNNDFRANRAPAP